MNETFYNYVDLFLNPIDDPGSRLFHWNISIALILVLLWIVFQYGFKDFSSNIKKIIFRKKYWWNKSTRRDYQIYFLNSVFKILLFIPFLNFSYEIGVFISKNLMLLNNDNSLGLYINSPWIIIFTILGFLLDDLFRFLHHLMMHKINFLWKLHSVHHSAKILTPVTLFRIHPLESAMATFRNSLSFGIITGLFVFCFSQTLTLWTILGINVFGFVFNLLGANLRHSHIPISFGSFFESIFISPKQHQIHHSSLLEHRDKNFGVSLSIWDKFFGTWVPSKDVQKKLKFGIGSLQGRRLIDELSLRKRRS